MPETDLVPCFYPGSAQSSGPDFTISRMQCRQWMQEGKGHFCRHGTMFQMDRARDVDIDKVIGRGNILTFSRSQRQVGNLHLRPDPINYPIPAVGDHRIRWHLLFMAMPNEIPVEV